MKKMMLYAKDCTVVPSNEEQVDTALLIIDEDGTVTGVTDKTKLNGTLALPAEVKKIDNNAFAGCTGLTSIGFSACTGLTKIGWGAFDGCTGLTGILDLSVCTNLTEIGGMAFKGYTDFIQFLDDDRFFNRIRIGAFCFCTGLTEVHLPASLTKIGVNAFSKCSNLHTLTVDPANKTYCSYDNVIYTKDMKTLVCAAGGITHISIPDTVIEIGKYVFEDISPDALFTVATEAVKQLLKYSESGIKDEQITVKGFN